MLKPIGGRVEPTYLEAIRNYMQKPKRGRSVMAETAVISMLKVGFTKLNSVLLQHTWFKV
jgi:hypothetical protein